MADRLRRFLLSVSLMLVAMLSLGLILETYVNVENQTAPAVHWRDKQRNGIILESSSNCNIENYIFGQRILQTDPCLVTTFKKKLLIPPPAFEEVNQDELNVSGEIRSNIEKFHWIEKLLIKSSSYKSGFFVECGANDGEFISPTIRLEKLYNWTGLLIEANPIPFESLLKKKRNAWAVNVAACTTEHPEIITFYTNPSHTGLSGLNERKDFGVTVNVSVQCIPLYTMLTAINVTTVDYLSLDVEGLELAILKTLPFDKITFKAMTVEYVSIPGKQKALKEFLEPIGYRFVKDITDHLTEDCLFVHESLYQLAISILPELSNSHSLLKAH